MKNIEIEADEKYRTIFDNAGDAIFIHDKDGKILSANKTASLQYGYTREEFLSMSVSMLDTDDEQKYIHERFNELILNGAVNFETTSLRKDNTVFNNNVNVKQINWNNQPAFLSICRDITARKETENRLKESEMRFKALHAASFGGIAIHDKGFILECNQGLADMTGYSTDELMGMDGLLLIAEQSRSAVMNNIVSEYEKPYEAVGLRKNGEEYPLRLSARMVPYKGKQVRTVEFRDITEQKQTELALAAEKERLNVTLASIGDGVITTDIKGNITMLNKAAENLTGWDSLAALGQPLQTVFNIVNEHTKQKCINPVERVLNNNKIIDLESNTSLTAKDNHEIIIEYSGAPIHDKERKIIGVVLVFRDMTQKKKLDDSIQRSQKLESIGLLAGGIAHDFNNLLGCIFGYLELALDETTQKDVSTFLMEALSSINRARGLTQQLLTFSKGGAPVKKSDNLFPFIQKTVQFALSGTKVSSRFEIDKKLWQCDYDKNQIGQVFENLTINATQAMPHGGTIAFSANNISLKENEYISLAAGNYVKLSIKDQGTGIPKEFLPRIFDPYYTTKTNSHGLGLTTCYSIIKRHNGFIDVESQTGIGTTFNIFLPAHIQKDTSPKKETSKKHSGKGTFLVMDDEKGIRNIIKLVLESYGYTVVEKEKGEDAIEFFKAELEENRTLSGMIFDLTIPGGMGGRDAIGEIRKLDSATPVYAASGYSDDPIMSNPKKFGFNASIIKPFSMTELSALLENNVKS
ncbi:MAG: PAS domain S-box protein [Deltaproteobacteria bacterium]|nr:PAS domain S-box protein [Deltaproteobacteria bacterium]